MCRFVRQHILDGLTGTALQQAVRSHFQRATAILAHGPGSWPPAS